MVIRVLIFASLVTRVGSRQLSLELANDATVSDALDAIALQFPDMADSRDRLAVAVNHSYADVGRRLSAGDELALIPPVSGG